MKITNNIPRALAEKVTKNELTELEKSIGKVCLISINEPEEEPAIIKDEAWDDILRIAFWDVTKSVKHFTEDKLFYPMAEEQGKEIADFIKKHNDDTIIVHCRAGISRSAAVVRLLLELGWEEGKILRVHSQQAYNVHVYSLVKKHFTELLPIGV